ncbi:969_t:CDS:2, partial [Ambispora leptoticha]
VKKITIEKDNQIVRRLDKTRKESFPDLALEKLEMEKERRKVLREAANQKEKEKLQQEKQRREEAEKRSYESLFASSNMRSNWQNTDVKDINEWEEDFM